MHWVGGGEDFVCVGGGGDCCFWEESHYKCFSVDLKGVIGTYENSSLLS